MPPPPLLCTQAGDPDHYACIGVTHDATADELRRAYRKVSLASHPDKPGGSEEAFSRVSAAYKVLARRRPTRSPTCKPGTPAVNLAPDAVFASCPHPEPPKEARTKREARRREPLACRPHPEPHRRHCGRTLFHPPTHNQEPYDTLTVKSSQRETHCLTPHQVLSDERTRRDYDEGSDVVLQGRDEAGGLREQVGLAIHPHPNAR